MSDMNDDANINDLSPEEINELFEEIIELPESQRLASYEGSCGSKWTSN